MTPEAGGFGLPPQLRATGSMAQNFKCGTCGSLFNDMSVFGIDVLEVHQPKAS